MIDEMGAEKKPQKLLEDENQGDAVENVTEDFIDLSFKRKTVVKDKEPYTRDSKNHNYLIEKTRNPLIKGIHL